MDGTDVGSQERNKIEQETGVSFAGKGRPTFTKSKKEKVETEADLEAMKMQQKMSEGIG
jgi:hypothetical protein